MTLWEMIDRSKKRKALERLRQYHLNEAWIIEQQINARSAE